MNNKTTNKATFRKVGQIQNLYRHAKKGTYYSLIKRSGKQFRRSLKTNDLQLAKIRLNELQRDISKLTNSSDSKLPFNPIALRWLKTKESTNKPSSILRRRTCIKNLSSYFASKAIDKILPLHCKECDAHRGRMSLRRQGNSKSPHSRLSSNMPLITA